MAEASKKTKAAPKTPPAKKTPAAIKAAKAKVTDEQVKAGGEALMNAVLGGPKRTRTAPAEPQKHAGGRPTKLNKGLIEEACEYLEEGAYAIVVAKALGITEGTWYAWLERGRQCEAKSPSKRTPTDLLAFDFLVAVERAEARGELKMGRDVRRGILGWQGPAWMMERKWPDRWGRSRAETPESGGLGALVDAIAAARAGQKAS
jgi:transposase